MDKKLSKRYVYECDQCDAVFKLPSHLKSHLGKSHKEKVYDCRACSCAFTTHKDLVIHLGTHVSKKYL